ncbi:MAG: XVIPCD domain-containing protein [Silanimonas sp.]
MSLFPNDDAWNAFQQRYLPMLAPGGPAPLAELIASGRYNEVPLTSDDMGEIFARAIGGQNTNMGVAVLGNDHVAGLSTARARNGEAPTPADQLIADQTVIAPALDAAFRAGHVTVDDLTAIGRDHGPEGLGEARMAGLLSRHDGGPGGAGEAYALALLETYYPLPRPENDTPPTDPAVLRGQGLAFSLLANDPALREKHFGENGDIPARHAFETLVAYNDQNPYNPDDGVLLSDRAASGLTAATALYADHSEALLTHYTGGGNGELGENHVTSDPKPLVHFFAQASINPNARDLTIPAESGAERPLHEVIASETSSYVERRAEFLETTPSQHHKDNVMAQLGVLQASTQFATDLELSRYGEAVAKHAELGQWFMSAGEELAGASPAAKVPVAGDLLVRGAGAAGGLLGDWFAGDEPVAPSGSDHAIAQGAIYDRLNTVEGRRASNGLDYYDLQRTFEDVLENKSNLFLQRWNNDVGSPAHAIPDEQHAFRADTPDRTTDVASLSSPDHPDSARYAASLRGCEGCRLPLDATELANVASTVALRSREAGLPSVDHVVASPGGDRVFAVAGRLDDPAHLRISVPVDEARGRTVEANSREWAELERTRTAEVTPDVELAQRSAPRMA